MKENGARSECFLKCYLDSDRAYKYLDNIYIYIWDNKCLISKR
jgi:hypothetical protein